MQQSYAAMWEWQLNMFRKLQLEHKDKEIIKNFNNNKVNLAISMAKEEEKQGNYEATWKFICELYPNILSLSEDEKLKQQLILINLLETISENNPHYIEANERLVALYGDTTINQTERLEKQLLAAKNSKDQRLVSQLFNQLCGIEFNLNPLSFEDLKSFAAFIRSQQETINQLQERLASLNVATSEEQVVANRPTMF